MIGSDARRDVDELRAGAAEVADRERVGAAAEHRVDLLDARESEHDVAVREAQPAAVGVQRERLGGVRAGEGQGVTAGAAVDDVAAVAGLPA